MTKDLNIGLAGLGVVGGGVHEILTKDIAILNKRSKRKLNLVAAAAKSEDELPKGSPAKFFSSPIEMAKSDDVDVIIELMGGSEGIAYETAKAALNAGKHYVTANKALIAVHGLELAEIAEKNNVALCFEAAVAGTVPILKSLRDGLAANEVDKIYAILNGTCNYILTKMESDNISFEVALKQAQELGYAEYDPTFDIENIDSSHKLSILAAIAKNTKVDFEALHIEGITKISIEDINFANELGYKIKSLGIFEDFKNGKIKQAVHPALVSKSTQLAAVSDSYNAILLHASSAEWVLEVGRGAGSKPTASAVVSDILDIANDRHSPSFGCPVKDLSEAQTISINERVGQYYLRFYADKEFAKESSFIKDVFNKEIIEQTLVKDAEDKIIYALKISEISEKEMNSYLDKLKAISKISDINMVRIENIA